MFRIQKQILYSTTPQVPMRRARGGSFESAGKRGKREDRGQRTESRERGFRLFVCSLCLFRGLFVCLFAFVVWVNTHTHTIYRPRDATRLTRRDSRDPQPTSVAYRARARAIMRAVPTPTRGLPFSYKFFFFSHFSFCAIGDCPECRVNVSVGLSPCDPHIRLIGSWHRWKACSSSREREPGSWLAG